MKPMLLACPLVCLLAATAAAQATIPPECQPMMAAGEKQFTVPSHAFIASKGVGPTPLLSETINAGGASYIKVRDRWMKSPTTPEQVAAQSKQAMRTASAYSCRQLPDDLVGVVPATVYTSHTETATGKTDTKVWVHKANGLPLKSEVDIDSHGHQMQMSVRYEYDNVKAPAIGQ